MVLCTAVCKTPTIKFKMFCVVYCGLTNHQQIEAFLRVKWFIMGGISAGVTDFFNVNLIFLNPEKVRGGYAPEYVLSIVFAIESVVSY